MLTANPTTPAVRLQAAILALYPGLTTIKVTTGAHGRLWIRVRFWADAGLLDGYPQEVERRASVSGFSPQAALRHLIDRIDAQPELRRAALAA